MDWFHKHWNPKVPKSSFQRQWVEEFIEKGHSPLQISLALNAVSMADDFIWYANALKNRQMSLVPTLNELDQWQEFWMNRDYLWNTLLKAFCQSDELTHEPRTYARWFNVQCKRWPRLSKKERQKILGNIDGPSLQEAIERGQQAAMDLLNEDLEEAYHGKSMVTNSEISAGVVLPFKFMLSVALPAYLEFGFPHDEIYRQAFKQSDFQSLQRLLRLDPASRQLPGITEQINHLILSGPTERAAALEIEAIRPVTMPASKIRTACKATLIGWVIDQSKLSKGKPELGKEFKIPKLEKLFDAHARDRLQKARDEDISESPEAFRKMVGRIRKQRTFVFWDIFRALDVPQF